MEAHILGRVVTACAVTVGVGCFLANVMFYEALMATLANGPTPRACGCGIAPPLLIEKHPSELAPQKLDTLL